MMVIGMMKMMPVIVPVTYCGRQLLYNSGHQATEDSEDVLVGPDEPALHTRWRS